MALDWSREISFSGLKKNGKRQKSDVIPTKEHMNLVAQDKKERNVKKTVLVTVIILVVAALFAKFAVIDFMAQVGAKQSELAEQQQLKTATLEKLSAYEEIASEYEKYGFFELDDAKGTLSVDAMAALDLVDKHIANKATVSGLNLVGDTMTLTLTDISLNDVGKLTDELDKIDFVQSVSVSTAATQSDPGSVVTTMIIKLGEGE